jgi:hypothetical protein
MPNRLASGLSINKRNKEKYMTQKQRKIRYMVTTIVVLGVLMILNALFWYWMNRGTLKSGPYGQYFTLHMLSGITVLPVLSGYLSSLLIRATHHEVEAIDQKAKPYRIALATLAGSAQPGLGVIILWCCLILTSWTGESLVYIALLPALFLLWPSIVMAGIMRQKRSGATRYLMERDDKSKVWRRLILVHGIQVVAWLGLFYFMANTYFYSTVGAYIVLLYGCVGAPVFTWILVTKVFKKWFVVADSESFSQWLADKQTKQGEIHDTKTT